MHSSHVHMDSWKWAEQLACENDQIPWERHHCMSKLWRSKILTELFFPSSFKHIHQLSKKFLLKQILLSPKLHEDQNFAFLIILIHRNHFYLLVPPNIVKYWFRKVSKCKNESGREENGVHSNFHPDLIFTWTFFTLTKFLPGCNFCRT